jgi:hypothetical protein
MSALTKSTKAALAGTVLVIGLVSLATGIGFLSESSVFSLPPVIEKTHSGGAATTEYLDQFKAHAMGITMTQYIKHREDNRY